MTCFTRSFESLFDILNVIDSFSASDPGRIIHTVAIKSVISTEYVQKAASAHIALVSRWELWKWLPLWFLSAFQTSAAVSLSVRFWQQIFE